MIAPLIIVFIHGLLGCIAAIWSLQYAYRVGNNLESRIKSMQIGVIADIVLVVTIVTFFSLPMLAITFIAKYLFLLIVDFERTFGK